MKQNVKGRVQSNGTIDKRVKADDLISLRIYVTDHCTNCAYSYTVADVIRHDFPEVDLRFINMSNPQEEIPDVVFATPTYLLNGRVWSLGNPSMEQVQETLSRLISAHQPQVG